MNKNNNKRLIGTNVLMVAALAFGQVAWAETNFVDQVAARRGDIRGIFSDTDTHHVFVMNGGSLGILNNSKLHVLFDNSPEALLGNGEAVIGENPYGDPAIADVFDGGRLEVDGKIRIGVLGNGTLNVTDGGKVYSHSESLVGGYSGESYYGGTGTVNIKGENSLWGINSTYGLDVNNNGTLNIENGGKVGLAIDSGFPRPDIRVQLGGAINVAGVDSQLGHLNKINVDGELNVSDGGVASALDVYVGRTGALALDNGGVLGKVPLGMDMGSRLVVHNYGTVSGDGGRIDGDVINYGLISPGNSPGILTITGDLTLKNDSVLHMEIFGPTAYDQLIIGGNFVAGGVLELDFGGYTPGFDTAYDLFRVSRMSGDFSEIRYLNLAENFDTDLLSRGFDNGIFRLIMASNDDPVIPGDPGNNTVPEPSSGLLIALGGLAMLMLRRRNSAISLI